MKTILRFTAGWCQPCKIYAPTFDKVASETVGVRFETVDVDSTDPRIIQYGVRNVPTTVVLNGTEVITKQAGIISEDQLKRMIG